MRIKWIDVGKTTAPGVYSVRGENIQVRHQEVSTWQEHPEAVFNTTEALYIEGRYLRALGTYALPEDDI